MKKTFIVSIVAVLLVVGMSFSVNADYMDGTVNDTVFEQKERTLLGEYFNSGALGGKLIPILVQVYGADPVEKNAANCYSHIQTTVIQNPEGITITKNLLDGLTKFVFSSPRKQCYAVAVLRITRD